MSPATPLWEAPSLFLGLTFALDSVGLPFLALTLLLWGTVSLYALAYHRDDPARGTLLAFWLPTFAGNLGLVLAADLLTFYLAFALMTFAGWGLVIHTRSAEALRAGKVYLVLALLGEVALLGALLALAGGLAGDGIVALPFGSELALAWEAVGPRGPLVAILALAGFGVKAGLVPLHLWLPLAHPVAPTPASALLSGVMIKAGVIGWLRVLPPDLSLPLGGVGEGLMVLGVVGAAWGVVCGLPQRDPKAILAYSSVSQMGYLTLAMGMVLVTPQSAGLPITGLPLTALLIFVVHHGVAKGALFLAVGVADQAPAGPHPLRHLIRLGVALSALALAGAPLTSGAAAKEGLKAGLGEVGGGWYAALNPILLVLATGTVLLLVRFALRLEARAASNEAPRPGVGGLVVPWFALVLAGVAGPWWIGSLLSPGFGAERTLAPPLPGLTSGWLAALAPILAGAAVALLVVRSTGAQRWMSEIRIPLGDLLGPIERGVAQAPSLVRPVASLAQKVAIHLEVAGAIGHRQFAALGRRDLALMRSALLAALMAGLVAGIWLLLLRGIHG